ncbi:hypothetical protein EJB05_39783, partial [Eragrostis curvula]
MAIFKNFSDASLRPPAHDHQPPAKASAPVTWAMLDIKAYIADRRNATTAFGRTSNGAEIQVTFCTAPPPAVSYFCVWCPEPSRVTEIATEPKIIAAEADVVVLSLGLTSSGSCFDHGNRDIFIYKAGGGEKRPSLNRLVCRCHHSELFHNVGILHHRNDDSSPDDDQYHVVGLNPSEFPWQFELHISNSKAEHWSHRTVSLDQQHRRSEFRHSASKVIMLGEGGLMGFVDPWRGILVCDVLYSTHLNYLPFPLSLRHNMKLHLDPVIARDIAVVKGRIKVVDLSGAFVSSGWKATMWSRTAASSQEEEWSMDFALQIRDVLVDSNTLHLELLPELKDDVGNGTSRKNLEGLHLTHPTLSLDDDDIVYFMAKVDPWDKRAWVLAVDMRNKKLRDVGVFRAERTHGIALSYTQSRIPKYFSTAPGVKGGLKRPRKFLLENPRKKRSGIQLTDDIAYAPMQHDNQSSTGDEDGDYMDLD